MSPERVLEFHCRLVQPFFCLSKRFELCAPPAEAIALHTVVVPQHMLLSVDRPTFISLPRTSIHFKFFFVKPQGFIMNLDPFTGSILLRGQHRVAKCVCFSTVTVSRLFLTKMFILSRWACMPLIDFFSVPLICC